MKLHGSTGEKKTRSLMFICAMNPSWYTQTEFAYQYGFRETASRFLETPYLTRVKRFKQEPVKSEPG
jgi:hypothetical protein